MVVNLPYRYLEAEVITWDNIQRFVFQQLSSQNSLHHHQFRLLEGPNLPCLPLQRSSFLKHRATQLSGYNLNTGPCEVGFFFVPLIVLPHKEINSPKIANVHTAQAPLPPLTPIPLEEPLQCW